MRRETGRNSGNCGVSVSNEGGGRVRSVCASQGGSGVEGVSRPAAGDADEDREEEVCERCL